MKQFTDHRKDVTVAHSTTSSSSSNTVLCSKLVYWTVLSTVFVINCTSLMAIQCRMTFFGGGISLFLTPHVCLFVVVTVEQHREGLCLLYIEVAPFLSF